MPATIGTYLMDIFSGRDPNGTPPLATSDAGAASVSDVLRDRAAGLVRDPTREAVDAMTSMSYYTGLGLTGSEAGRLSSYLDSRGRTTAGFTTATRTAPASTSGSTMPLSTWMIGLIAAGLALLLFVNGTRRR